MEQVPNEENICEVGILHREFDIYNKTMRRIQLSKQPNRRTFATLIALVFAWAPFDMQAAGQLQQSADTRQGVQAVESDKLAKELATLKSRIEAGQLSEEQAKAAAASLAIVESNISRLASSNDRQRVNASLSQSLQSRLKELKKKPEDSNVRTMPESSTVVEFEEAKQFSASELETAQLELKAVQESISKRSELTRSNRESIAQLEKQKIDYEAQLEKQGLPETHPLVADAKKLELTSAASCVSAEIGRLNSELDLFQAEEQAGYLVAANEYWSAMVKLRQKSFDSIASQLEQRRRAETQKSVSEAKAEIESVPESLRGFAEENARLAELATSLLEPLRKSQQALKVESLKLDQLQKQFASTKLRVETVGLTSSVGAYLRNRKSEIPHEGWMQATLLDRLSEIEKHQSQLFDLEESKQSLLTDDVVADATRLLPNGATDQQIENVKAAATALVNRRRELLSHASTNHRDLLTALDGLKTTEYSLGELTAEFHEYINERILWIRSNGTLFTEFKRDDSDAALLNAANWIGLGKSFVADFFRNILIYIATIVAFLYLFLRRGKLRSTIAQKSEQVMRGTNTSFLPTLEALLLTLIIALPIPLLLAMAGWRMLAMPTESALAVATGKALIATASFFFLAEFLRQIVRKSGIGECHFRWSTSTLSKLNRELSWFVPTASFFAFACTFLYSVDLIHQTDIVERVVLIAAIAQLAVFLYRTLHPENGIFREQFVAFPKSWITQTKKSWFWMIIAVPVALILMIIIGYYYSAIQMLSRLYWTIVVVVGLELLRSLVMKFVSLSRRRARIAQARARLAAQSSSEDGARSEKTGELERVADQEVYLASENEAMDENFVRSQKLVTAGMAIACTVWLFMIWADVFPAIKGLDRYVFWTTTVERLADSTDSSSAVPLLSSPATPAIASLSKSDEKNESVVAAASPETGAVKELKNVTLRNLLLAILVLGLSIFAVRNLPAFIELVFLKHLPLEQSLRHAIKAITGYVILMFGILAAGRMMYIGWGQIQWLATALTFGLAFGLQEIFANFIAGIILLLERPIRIGDIVEVGEVRGTVTRIRIRATTIRSFDQKDFVVPNKEFITGRLLNWTLSDKVVRQTLRVGVAYGSDVRKAKEIIRGICETHPSILADPKPVITFEEFADSTLNISARVHLKDFDAWWPTMDEINLQIDDAFKAAGIEIAFPQRDLHIRSTSEEITKALAKNDRTISDSRDGTPDGYLASQ